MENHYFNTDKVKPQTISSFKDLATPAGLRDLVICHTKTEKLTTHPDQVTKYTAEAGVKTQDYTKAPNKSCLI